MDNEKSYKDALDLMRKMVAEGRVPQEVAEQYFPELAESEDEKVRKAIIQAVELHKDFTQAKKEKNYAWLEKQGEPKPADKVERKGMNIVEEYMTPFQKKVFCIIDTTIEEEQGLKQVCDELLRLAHDEIEQKPVKLSDDFEEEMDRYIEENFYGSDTCGFFSNRTKRELEAEDVVRIGCHFAAWQKEQSDKELLDKTKREWNDEDENNISDLCSFIVESYRPEDASSLITWLKSIKDRVQPQPRQEWSEKDAKMLNKVIEDIVKLAGPYVCYHKDVDWLKSLRPQNHWKPSDEQMEALDFAANCIVPAEFCIKRKVLKGLLEQLKKLSQE